ncbi:MAG: 16S rRNA (guanine(527)-N(7))-methyltransferase RsmG [Spirochaetales bacterium]|nr:16S rRNA (guanine(527)-N(7))-methyltransferase RsmG [Spirochaetales bacterium]MCF7939071.1 16S rRNA (guanine(527)-N(7))-methyltransferase RsmG [Spirochaetales bacterium]
MDSLAEETARGLEAMDISFSRQQLEQLGVYLDELIFWNRKLALISRSDRLPAEHVLDSLAALPVLDEFAEQAGRTGAAKKRPFRAADIGSGAGLPGIPLAVMRPDWEFVLFERSEKKAGFLRNAVPAVGAENVEIAASDVTSKDVPDGFDLILFRALGSLADWVPAVVPLLKENGLVAAYKGKRSTVEKELEELRSVCSSISDPVVRELPSPGGKERLLVTMRPERS